MTLHHRGKQLILLIGDLTSYLFAFWFSLALRYREVPDTTLIDKHLSMFLGLFFIWIVINFINGLYDQKVLGNSKEFYQRMGESASIVFLVSIVFFYLMPKTAITPKTILLLNVVFGYTISALWRFLYNTVIGDTRLQTSVMIIGYTSETKELLHILATQKTGYQAKVLIDPSNESRAEDFPNTDIYRRLEAIRPSITTHAIQLVIVSPNLRNQGGVIRELYELLFWPVQMSDAITFYEIITGRIPPSTFSESWFLDHLRVDEYRLYNTIRAMIDYVFGILLMGICVALFPLVAILVKTSSRGPLFIKQKRVGKAGQSFFLYKFRSMYALSADGSAETKGVQFAIKGDPRVTPIGKWLRKTRLDELPQAWNLLKQDITLVGPRPERPEIVKELEINMPYYSLRHMVRPGLTGWAVLHQNYTDTMETSLQKLQYDLYYIKNRSLLLDLSILLRTVNVVVRLKGQ